MRAIITGGTGLIGSKLVDKMAARGDEVVVLTRSPQKYRHKTKVSYVKWDAKSAAGWGHHVEDADVIVNLAGESISGDGFPPPRWTKEKKQRILQSRLDAGNAVVEAVAAASSKPSVLLQASAVGYYGDRGAEALDAQAAPGKGFLPNVVQAWEASTESVEAMGVRRIVTRIGIVYSTEGGALPNLLLPFKLFVGGPLGDGKQFMPWIHMDDVVNGILFLIETESAQGPFNLTAPNPLMNKEMAQVIGKVMNRPAFMPAPAIALKLALGEMAVIILDGQNAVPAKLEALDYPFKFETAEAALTDLLK